MGAYLSEPVTEKISNDEADIKLEYGASSMQGWRVNQEDAHNTILDFDVNTALFAVYDGHGGAEVATYCSQKLPDFIKNTEAYKKGELVQALEEAFLGFDATIQTKEIMDVLKELAGEINPPEASDNEESDEDDIVSNLYQEAKLPLQEVLAKYENKLGTLHRARLGDSGVPLSPCLRAKKSFENSGEGASSSGSVNEPAGSHKGDASSSINVSSTPNDEEETPKNNGGGDAGVSSTNSNEEDKDVNGEVSTSEPTEATNDISMDSDKSNNAAPDSSEDNCLKPEQSEITSKAEGNSMEICNGEVTDSKCNDEVSDSKPNDEVTDSKTTDEVTDSKTNDEVTDSKSKDEVTDSKSKDEVTDSKQLDGEENNISSSNGATPVKKGKAKDKSSSVSSSEAKDPPERPKKANIRRAAAAVYKNILMQAAEEDEEESDSNDETFEGGEVNSSDEENVNGVSDSECEDEEEEEEEEYQSSDEDYEEDISMTEEPGNDSGCTAVVALLRGTELYVANAGDSRCIICREGKAIDMSIDHKPEDAPELERITKAGGKVSNDGRINGGLNLSRAIGDHSYKKNKELGPKEQMITALPDVKTLTIDPTKDEFMVLACDGIWNFMSSQEVCDFILPKLAEGRERLSQICEEMFDHCLAPSTMGDGTGCDNMTAIIIRFKDGLISEVGQHATKKRAAEDVEPEVLQDSKRQKVDDSLSSSVVTSSV